jgi:hypothetical protein
VRSENLKRLNISNETSLENFHDMKGVNPGLSEERRQKIAYQPQQQLIFQGIPRESYKSGTYNSTVIGGRCYQWSMQFILGDCSKFNECYTSEQIVN